MTKSFKRLKTSRDMFSFRIQENIELLPFLYKAFSNRSRNSVKSILRRGQVSVNGKETTQFNERLQEGDFVTVLKNEAAKRLGALVGIEILHENKDEFFTVQQQMIEYVKHQHLRNHIYMTHRLDRDTSGVMILARNIKTQHYLQNNWHEVVPERSYQALVEGEVEKDKGTVKSYLKETKTFYVYSTEDEDGLHAVTHYEKVKSNGKYSLLNVHLETGRKNQIRVHMKDLGHPVAGDKKYGAETNPLNRLCLHAQSITFIHPKTKKPVTVRAKAPRSFQRAVQ